jgi:sugar lactone lactonase YvrE
LLLALAARAERPSDVANHAARLAYEAKDWAALRTQLLTLYDLLSGHPRVVYNLACAEARLGHTAAGLEWLGVYADMGLTLPKADDPDLAALVAVPEYRPLAARFEKNAEPVVSSQIAFTFPEAELVPEDVAYDAKDHAFYVSSVRQRKILRIDSAWRVTDFTKEGQDGNGAMLALALDPERRVLWATSEGLPQARGLAAADRGRAAIVVYDLQSGRQLERYELPNDGQQHEPGDMALGRGGEVYVSDGGTGAVYAVRRKKLETIVAAGGMMRSPQQPALTADGRRLLVPDYGGGIAVVELATGRADWMAHPKGVALNGVDGLRLVGDTLWAVQNGTVPERVVRLTLDPAQQRVLRQDVLESASPDLGDPTHGIVVGDTYYFIANSGWDHMKEDGSVEGALTRATLRRIPLRPAGAN